LPHPVYCVALTDHDGVGGGCGVRPQRSLLQSPQFGRHSAPSRPTHSAHLPPGPSDVTTPPGGRSPNTGMHEVVASSAVSPPLTGRRPAAPCPDSRRTYKVKPGVVVVVGPADRRQQHLPSSSHAADVDRIPRDEFPGDGFVDLHGRVIDNRRP